MRRPAPILIACLLALATGVALLGASTMIAAPPRAGGSTVTANPGLGANAALARRFYEAINMILETGDSAPLVALVTTDFVDRGGKGIVPTNMDFEQRLRALHASFPDMWLAIEDLQPQGDWVLARIRVHGLQQGTFLGAPIFMNPATWEITELLRVVGDRVAERWADGAWPEPPQTLVQFQLPRAPATAFIRLGRLTFAPGASRPRSATLGSVLIAVEHGSLSAQVEGKALLSRVAESGASASPVEGELLLNRGDALLLPMSTRYALRNAGREASVALTMTLFPWSGGTTEGALILWPEATLPNVDAQLLVEGAVTELPEGPATVTLGRMTVAAELATAGKSTLRIAEVEAGVLQIDALFGPGLTLASGQGMLIETAPSQTFRNVGDTPFVLLMVAIAPAS
jgi:hypothetical protein